MESENSDFNSSDDCNYDDYYNVDNDELDFLDSVRPDPEKFDCECFNIVKVERLLNESVDTLCDQLMISPSLAKLLLHTQGWNCKQIIENYFNDGEKLLIAAHIKPSKLILMPNYERQFCSVCATAHSYHSMYSLSCGHYFCKDCWTTYCEVKILQGISTGIECMAKDCNILATESFILEFLDKSKLRDRYQQFAFCDYVKSHPHLRFCPGPDCSVIMFATNPQAKRAKCIQCSTGFCFNCGGDYHAPTNCETINKWLTKCADNSETANYIRAHTKDCPRCHICIEKNGGCNHMKCFSCKHEFCWMCLGDWKTHGSEYYECSRYKENPEIAQESQHAKAREALKKYLFYYERWENHAKSLKLEKATLAKIHARINEKVQSNCGTWIDWQYLLDSAELLARCRYTLQYTYPYAYYMEQGSRKQLFEYQQAQLEAEIENLSWKIEHAETVKRGDLQYQMDVAEKRRTVLLQDFFEF